MNCVIVDDNELDRLMIQSCLSRFPQFKVVGIFESAIEALPFLEKESISVLFLDIDMPEMSGLELRKLMPEIPVCIFITAHPEHALESFEVETLDFLVKPIQLNRFELTVNRIEEFLSLKEKATLLENNLGGDSIFIKEGHQQTKIQLSDILYLEALKDYTLLITKEKRYCVLISLGAILKQIHFQSFVRIHRSYAVQKLVVVGHNSQEVSLINQHKLPVGRSYKSNLAEFS